MKNTYILLLSVFLALKMQAQIGSQGNNNVPMPEEDWVCYHENTSQFFGQNKSIVSSTFGQAFTPKGDIKVLVIFVEFENNNDPNPLPGWNEGELPNVFDANQKLRFGYENINEFDPLGSPNLDAHDNISEFLYQMSNGELRVLFEPHKDNNGNPEVIVVDPTGIQSIHSVSALAIDKIKTLYPNRNYANLGFDIRPDSPDFDVDASATFSQPQPNNVIDFTLLIHRNAADFSGDYTPNGGLFSPEGAAVSHELPNLEIANGTFVQDANTLIIYTGYYPRTLDNIVHEMMHSVINLPHSSLANSVHGRHFYASRTSGMMSYGGANSLANAWERWYLGWTDITHDLENSSDNGTYILNDYFNSSESLRLKLPFVDEYVWLTYQDNNANTFYNRTPPEFDVGGQLEQPLPQEGLYGFIEKTAKSRTTMIGATNPANVNTQKIMNGNGNFDYSIRGVSNNPGEWISLSQIESNSYGGHHEGIGFRLDNNSDGQINHGFSGGGSAFNEYYNITRVNGNDKISKLLDKSFLPEKKYSSFSNPSISNFQEISSFSINKLEPIFLHSLSFKSRESNGQMLIEVDYDDGHIEEDFRMTGNVYLPENEDIFLDKDITLTINRSGTPNLRNDLFNVPNPTIDQFISPTAFIAASNSSFSLNKEGTIIIDEGSTVIFEEDSQLNLEQGAQIIVRGGSLLCIKTDDVNFANFTSRIIVEDGFLNISSGININSNVTTLNNFGLPTISPIVDYCGDIQTSVYLHSTQETNSGDPNCALDVTINSNQEVKLTSQEIVDIGPGFEVVEGAYFDAAIQYIIPQDCNLEFFFGNGGIPGTLWDGPNDDGIDKNSKVKLSINVFPNPSRNIFNVHLNESKGKFSYHIRDFTGNEIQSKNNLNNNFSFDLSEYPRGIYFLIISDGYLTETIELLKI